MLTAYQLTGHLRDQGFDASRRGAHVAIVFAEQEIVVSRDDGPAWAALSGDTDGALAYLAAESAVSWVRLSRPADLLNAVRCALSMVGPTWRPALAAAFATKVRSVEALTLPEMERAAARAQADLNAARLGITAALKLLEPTP